MNSALLWLALVSMMAAPVEVSEEPETLLFVRTTPAGAEVLLDGEPLGTTDDLFRVEPGVRRIVIEMEGHVPQSEEVTIRVGEVTRVVLELQQQPSEHHFGPIVERELVDAGSGGRGFIDLDTGRFYRPPPRLWEDADAESAWCGRLGIDASILFGQVRPDMTSGSGSPTIMALCPMGSTVIERVADDVWTESGESLVTRDVSLLTNFTESAALPLTSLPATFIVATDRDSLGVLQITAVDPERPSAKIRYRLLDASDARSPDGVPWTWIAQQTQSHRFKERATHMLDGLPVEQRQTAVRKQILNSSIDAIVADLLAKLRLLPQKDRASLLDLVRSDLRLQTLVAHGSSSDEAREEVVRKATAPIRQYAHAEQEPPPEWTSGHDALLLALSFLGHEDSLRETVAAYQRLQASYGNPVDGEDWIPLDHGHNPFFYAHWDMALLAYATRWDDDGNAPRPPKWVAVQYRALRTEDQKQTYYCAGKSLTIGYAWGLSGLAGDRIWEFQEAMQQARLWAPTPQYETSSAPTVLVEGREYAKIAETDWGPERNGAQCYLQAQRQVWQSWETPQYLLSIRSVGDARTRLSGVNLLVNGVLCQMYQRTPAQEIPPGQQIAIPLDVTNRLSGHPSFNTGLCVAQAGLLGDGYGLPGTNSVTVEILPPGASSVEEVERALNRYEINGQEILAGFLPSKTSFVQGEPMGAAFLVKNLSGREYAFDFGGDYRGTGRHDRFKITATDPELEPLRDPKAGPQGFIITGGGIMMIRKAEPGCTSAEHFDLAQYRVFDKPGTCEVTCRFVLEPPHAFLFDGDLPPDANTTVESRFKLTIHPADDQHVRALMAELDEQIERNRGKLTPQVLATLCSVDNELLVPRLLELLRLPEWETGRAALHALAKFHELGRLDLRSLDLHATGVSDDDLQHAAKNLWTLNLSETAITDAGLAHLEGLAELQDLRLSGTEITDAGLQHLAGLDKLLFLHLNGTKTGDAGLAHLGDLTLLEGLYLEDTQIAGTGLVHLEGLTQLEDLRLGGAPLKDEELAGLKGLTALEYLDLHGTPITDAALVHLAGLTMLKALYLNDTQITGAGLVHLAGLSQLKELRLGRAPLEDEELAGLKGLTSLEKLDLRDTPITDAALTHISSLKNLQGLYVYQTKVTAEGVKRLQQALPDLGIWPTPESGLLAPPEVSQ